MTLRTEGKQTFSLLDPRRDFSHVSHSLMRLLNYSFLKEFVLSFLNHKDYFLQYFGNYFPKSFFHKFYLFYDFQVSK